MPEIKLAHESEDDTSILHCPFDGGGQVIASSDGSIHCEYCDRSFTVHLQPSFSGMPQELDQMNAGAPDFGPEGQGDPDAEQDPEAYPGAEDDPQESDVPQDGPLPEGSPSVAPSAQDEQVQPQLQTATGQKLPYEDYLDHLAVTHANDRDAVITAIKARRSGSARG